VSSTEQAAPRDLGSELGLVDNDPRKRYRVKAGDTATTNTDPPFQKQTRWEDDKTGGEAPTTGIKPAGSPPPRFKGRSIAAAAESREGSKCEECRRVTASAATVDAGCRPRSILRNADPTQTSDPDLTGTERAADTAPINQTGKTTDQMETDPDEHTGGAIASTTHAIQQNAALHVAAYKEQVRREAEAAYHISQQQMLRWLDQERRSCQDYAKPLLHDIRELQEKYNEDILQLQNQLEGAAEKLQGKDQEIAALQEELRAIRADGEQAQQRKELDARSQEMTKQKIPWREFRSSPPMAGMRIRGEEA